MTDQLTKIKFRKATEAELSRVHLKEYIKQVQVMSGADGGDASGLTPFAKGGFDIISLAAGGVIALFDTVMNGEVDNGYALI